MIDKRRKRPVHDLFRRIHEGMTKDAATHRTHPFGSAASMNENDPASREAPL